MMTSPIRSLAMAVFAVALLVAPAAMAQSIKVIVNDTPITSGDIQNRARLLQLATKIPAGQSTKAATEELIDDALRVQEAKRLGVNITDAMVDEAIAEIAGRSKLTPKQFAAALGQAGVRIGTLRDRLRAQLGWARIVRTKAQQAIRSEQNDLIAQMRRQEQGTSTATAEDFVLQRVVFTLPANANAAKVAQRRKEAENLRARFKGCEAGIPLAKTLKEVAVINVGRRLASEVPPSMLDFIKDTPEGGLTKPDVTAQGVEMFAVCQRIAVTGENAAAAAGMDAESMSKEAQEISANLVRELRQKANIVYR